MGGAGETQAPENAVIGPAPETADAAPAREQSGNAAVTAAARGGNAAFAAFVAGDAAPPPPGPGRRNGPPAAGLLARATFAPPHPPPEVSAEDRNIALGLSAAVRERAAEAGALPGGAPPSTAPPGGPLDAARAGEGAETATSPASGGPARAAGTEPARGVDPGAPVQRAGPAPADGTDSAARGAVAGADEHDGGREAAARAGAGEDEEDGPRRRIAPTGDQTDRGVPGAAAGASAVAPAAGLAANGAAPAAPGARAGPAAAGAGGPAPAVASGGRASPGGGGGVTIPSRPEGGGDGATAPPGEESAGPASLLDGDLIDVELAEHERWAGSFGDVGTAGSDDRVRFLIDQAGRGATAGAVSGAGMGFVMGAVGGAVGRIAGRRLATLAVSRGASVTPIPGLGSAIGGVMAIAGLAMRDWGQTRQTIGRIGTGTGYERLANDLEGIAEILDVASSIMDVLAGVLGAIAVGMWVGAVLSAGALSPLAAVLSAIALGMNIATTAVGVIINVILRPVITALRAMHTFESQASPQQIEQEGEQLQAAAGGVTGAIAGALAAKAGGRAGDRAGTHIDRGVRGVQGVVGGGGRPPRSAASEGGPRIHAEVPEAPPGRTDFDDEPTGQFQRPDIDDEPTQQFQRPDIDDEPTQPFQRPDIDDEPTQPFQRPDFDDEPTQPGGRRGDSEPQTPSATTAPPAPTAAPAQRYPDNAHTANTRDRAAAMAQYHEQIRLDPSRESAVYRDADGKYHVMQGKTTRVGFPPETDARPPLQLIYHSHPTQNTPREQGFVSQPSQAGGDFGVVQYQHGRTAPVGQRQSSELHFPVYNRAGEHVGYGTTTFHYDPTHPLPLQVETTLPGGRPTRQRYRSFEDFQRRAGVGPGGQTPEERAAASTQAREQLRADQEAGGRRVEEVAKQLPRPPTHRGSARAGAEAGGREPEPGAAGRPRLGPAYTARAAGLRPGESIDVPINPHYEPPPGTPAEIAALRERIAESRRVQASLAQTERAMGAQAAQQRAHDTQLQGAQTVATQLGTGRSAHQTAANTTSTANTQQRTAAQSTIDTLGQTSREYSGVATLVGSLRVFQGLAHLFGYLPGSLGSSAQRARGDAARLIASVERVRNADATRGQMQANSGSLAADATRIQQVQTRGAATDSEIARGGQGVEALRASNRERLAETTATRAQASDERETAADHQQEAQTKHDDLNVRMREWAQAHRAERSRAVEEASARLAAQGYRTRAEGT